MADKRTSFLLSINPPIGEVVFAFFGLALINVLFGYYLALDASPEMNVATRQVYLIQFHPPALGPDSITTRYGTFVQTTLWRTIGVALDLTLLLGVLVGIWAAIRAGIMKATGRP
jgi:hypothetical protein